MRATTLSQVIENDKIGDYVLVCDIEGSEAGIWGNDPESLAHCRQLLVELHNSPGVTVSMMMQQIVALGFVIRDSRHNVFFLEREKGLLIEG